MLLLSLVLFLLVLALPAVPSIFEVRSPKDDGRLHIMEQYVRDPRWFGRSSINSRRSSTKRAAIGTAAPNCGCAPTKRSAGRPIC
jgi:hypothetical protein